MSTVFLLTGGLKALSGSMWFVLFLACRPKPDLETKWVAQNEFRLIPEGEFLMGGDGGEPDTIPIHSQVIGRAYWVMSHEVTQSMYQEVMGQNPSQVPLPTHPVDSVSWLDAVRFANALSEQNALEPCYVFLDNGDVHWPKGFDCPGFRLLTEAEWEYAARANQDYGYSGSGDAHRVSWTQSNSQSSHPVGTLMANGFGLHDMTGNVAEWVWDPYELYPNTLQLKPTGIKGRNRVSRGCGWADRLNLCLVYQRFTDGSEWHFPWVGFRLAQSNIK